jgi:hypothetical protein
VANTTFSVASQLAVIETSTLDCGGPVEDGGSACVSTSSQSLLVLLTNRADANCAALQGEAETNTDVEFANLDGLEFQVSGGTPGVYDIVPSATPGVPSSAGASASFVTTTSACATGLDLSATSGTITLTQFTSARVTGTYDVTFAAQGRFSGSFDVAVCGAPDASSSAPQGPPVCSQ